MEIIRFLSHPMIFAYIRVSTDKQTTENQRFEILKFADEKQWKVNTWIEEIVSGIKRIKDRKFGKSLEKMKKDDVLIVSEISRLGRSMMEIMSILHDLMEKEVKVYTVKEKYELGNNINSHVLAFAFSLSAQIERDMISSRTKEALARKKSEGKNTWQTQREFVKANKTDWKRGRNTKPAAEKTFLQ